ncbi:MAG: RNA 2',3'-cyclic phosphodiesterase [Elusimicrobia bacterium]|nr:RNA 2',3'-cyclic phosphodiesterase [Elusimicrobiota bacterium]
MRLFIAVNIKEENKKEVLKIQSTFKESFFDIKWVESENLHLTLKFLGEIAEEKVNPLKEKIKQLVSGIKKFEIDFCRTGVFPNIEFPRVLWIGVEKGETELKNLSQNIETSLEEIGFEKEKKLFSVHLTIGRFRSGKNKEKLKDIIKKVSVEKYEDIVESVFLIRSTLTANGPVYNIIEEFQLR